MSNLPTDQETPQYPHDCDECTFLGRHGDCDLYFCDQGGSMPTLISRYGYEGSEYHSGLQAGYAYPALDEAGRRAMRKGLL